MKRALALAAFAAVCAAAAAWPERRSTHCLFNHRLVYSSDVTAGDRLSYEYLSQRTYPDDAHLDAASVDSASELIGRPVLGSHRAGELVLPHHLGPPPIDPRKGLRVVRLENAAGVAPAKGELVDVLGVFDDPGNGWPLSRTILQAARVREAAPGEVWLELLAEEAEALVEARATARTLSLTQRAPGDCELVEPGVTTQTSMLARFDRNAFFRCGHLIQVIRGSGRTR